jgi:tetratricopeptide (TPR) repeat protein
VVLVPCFVLGILEGSLRLLGVGTNPSFFLETRVNDRAVFVDNQRFGRFFFPPSLVRHPAPIQFDAVKGTNTLRIFVMGESAAMGDPDPFFGFGRILEVLLRERHPGLKVEVINTGITAINSHTVRAIAKDCASREGDFWIVYMGNNEVIGPYGPGTVFNSTSVPPLWLIRAQLALKMTRLGQCAERVAAPFFRGSTAPGTWSGMEMFIQSKVSADDPRMAGVHDNFRRNLEDIVRLGAAHGACVLLCPPAHNIRNCGPFASVHDPRLSAEDLSRWNQWYEQGKAVGATNEDLALDFFNKAEALDSRHADLAFRQGIIHANLKHQDQARQYLERARDLDALRFRPDRQINAIHRELAAAHAADNVRLVDTEAAVAQGSTNGLPGWEMLYDHVHCTFAGNYVLAMAMATNIDSSLPPRLKAIPETALPWLSQEECARRIAYTSFDQYQITDTMWGRMKHAPFTQQSDWNRNIGHLQDELNALKPQIKPWALKKFAEIHRQAVEHAPEDWNLLASHARLLQYAGNITNAIFQWRETLRLAPCHPQAHCNLGMLLAGAGNHEEALFHLQTALELCPEFPEALNSLGSMLAKKQQFKQALVYYQKAVELAPDSVPSLLNSARTLEQLGRHDSAARIFNRILALAPDNTEARRHLNIVGDAR